MSELVTIVGYSFDSVIEAVVQSTNGKKVKYLSTGEPGEPLDRFGDMVSGRYADMISILLPEVDFQAIRNPRHIYIPYDAVKLTNNSNGVFQLPFNKNSFTPTEYDEIAAGFASAEIQACYQNKSATPSKLVTAIKNKMPKAFSDTFAKALSTTRWRGIQLSHLTMFGYEYEYSFEHLNEDNFSEIYCIPKISYAEMCKRLFEKFNIECTSVTAEEVKKLITKRNTDGEVIIMDNRVDYYMNYVCGRFDRVSMSVEKVKMPHQFARCTDGLYYTPLSNDFWGIIVRGEDAFKCTSAKVNTLKLISATSEIPLTRNNVKLYDQYSKMIKLYGNKSIDLSQRIETLVK